MKIKKVSMKKMVLNKKTVAGLNNSELAKMNNNDQAKIYGGVVTIPRTCAVLCTAKCNP